MMLFRTHLVFGIFCFFVLERFVEMPVFVLGFVLLGACFVDIDSLNSKIGKRFWFLSWFFRHRGFLHSLVGCLVLSLIVGGFSLWAGFGFFIGYLSHLVLDCFTLAGVRLFWPFGRKVKGFIRSGNWAEDIAFVLVLLGDILWGVWLVFDYLF